MEMSSGGQIILAGGDTFVLLRVSLPIRNHKCEDELGDCIAFSRHSRFAQLRKSANPSHLGKVRGAQSRAPCQFTLSLNGCSITGRNQFNAASVMMEPSVAHATQKQE